MRTKALASHLWSGIHTHACMQAPLLHICGRTPYIQVPLPHICGSKCFTPAGACCTHILTSTKQLIAQSSPRSSVLGASLLSAAMADREMAWRALETLFGSEVRGPGSQPYMCKIVRVCGLSDRLTGPRGSTHTHICVVFRLHSFGSRSAHHFGGCFHRLLPETIQTTEQNDSRRRGAEIQHICRDLVRRAVNMTSNIRLQVYEEHVIEKKKTLLFESAKKTRSPNPVFLDRWSRFTQRNLKINGR